MKPALRQRAVEPGVGGHLDDGRDAAALLAHQHAPGVLELDLAAAVGAVADLVLQALDVDRVLAAVGPPARHEEAGRATLVGPGEHQVAVAHRRREEPLVAGEPVLGPHAPSPAGAARVVLVRRSLPPCFSVMPMPTVIERFCVSGTSRGSCSSDSQQRRGRGVQRRVQRASAGCRPWSSSSGRSSPTRSGCACTATRRSADQAEGRSSKNGRLAMPLRRAIDIMRVPGGMEPHLVDALAACANACAARARWRLASSAARKVGSAPYSAPWRTQLGVAPLRAAAFDRAAQHGVAGVDVVVPELGSLVVRVDADHGVSCAAEAGDR